MIDPDNLPEDFGMTETDSIVEEGPMFQKQKPQRHFVTITTSEGEVRAITPAAPNLHESGALLFASETGVGYAIAAHEWRMVSASTEEPEGFLDAGGEHSE